MGSLSLPLIVGTHCTRVCLTEWMFYHIHCRDPMRLLWHERCDAETYLNERAHPYMRES